MIESSVIECHRELVARGGLPEFIRLAWPLVEPSRPYVHTWHIDVVCEHLTAVSKGQIRNLVINVPPGSGKSRLVSVFWPVWEWITKPATRWIYASYDLGLTRRDAEAALSILSSSWFRARWGKHVSVNRQQPILEYENNRGGWRYGTSVRGPMTGRHADIRVVDDPVKPLEMGKLALDRCIEWNDLTLSTRVVDPKTSRYVLIMQRLHSRDLAGVLIDRGDCEVLRLPMRYESKNPCPSDRRTVEGELLYPSRADEQSVQKLERDLGPLGTAAQLQQRPVPAGGHIFELGWLGREFDALPQRPDQWCLSVDCSFKGAADSDFVAISVWCRKGPDYYLCDVVNERLSFSGTLIRIREIVAKWPLALTRLVEDAANGAAVVDVLRREFPGFELVKPQGGKEARANAVTPIFRSGNVWLPRGATWLREFRDQLTSFPRGANDDLVDATSQALSFMSANQSNLEAAMRQVRTNLL